MYSLYCNSTGSFELINLEKNWTIVADTSVKLPRLLGSRRKNFNRSTLPLLPVLLYNHFYTMERRNPTNSPRGFPGRLEPLSGDWSPDIAIRKNGKWIRNMRCKHQIHQIEWPASPMSAWNYIHKYNCFITANRCDSAVGRPTQQAVESMALGFLIIYIKAVIFIIYESRDLWFLRTSCRSSSWLDIIGTF